METAGPAWTAIADTEDVPHGGLKAVRHGERHLVVARTADGDFHVLDNRCPHEGYPLATGTLKDCALTCAWHNWKFDVRDGSCLVGGEAVRRYPARVADGRVHADLRDLDPSVQHEARLKSLHEAIFDHDVGRAVRDGVRLLASGYPSAELLTDLAAYDGRHGEWGSTHALPVAADVLRLLPRMPGAEAAYAIAPVIDLCAFDHRGRTPHPRVAPIAGAAEESLRTAVEAEDLPRALGLLSGALADGVPRAELDRWFFALVAGHHLSFGHPLIYLIKARELLDGAGEEAAARATPDVHAGLLRAIVYGTREDTLPYLRGYEKRAAEHADALPELHAHCRAAQSDAGADGDAAWDGSFLREAVLDAPRAADAVDALFIALRAGTPLERIAEELVLAGAERLLRFDANLDARDDLAETWLWATHRFTHAAAVRHATQHWDDPRVLRLLVHSVAFIHSGRPMDLAPQDRPERTPEPAGVDGILDAVRDRDPDRAVRHTLGHLAEHELAPLQRALEDFTLRDPVTLPIFVAHVIKTVFAACEEHAALARHPLRALPVAAAVRFLASPLRERRLHGTVENAVDFVVHGRMPRKLTQ